MNCLINPKLLDALVRRGCIKHRTEIDAFYRADDMAGNPLVRAHGTLIVIDILRSKTGDYIMKCADSYDGRIRTIKGTMIYRIDGMTPERFAQTHQISPTGETITPPPKRGRRPKRVQPKAQTTA